MTWVLSISLAVFSLTIHVLSVKVLGEKLPSSFVTPAFYCFALLLLFCIFAWDKPKIEIGLTDFFFVKSINLGGEASTVMPILLGGSAVLITLAATLFMKEVINPAKALGLIMTVLGIFLIYRS